MKIEISTSFWLTSKKGIIRGAERAVIKGTLKSILTAGLGLAAATEPVCATPDHVDLRDYQTSIKNQAGRNSCNFFSVTAAVEAAYKHRGYGDLDLSEEFFNHFQKMFAYKFLPQDGVEPGTAENNLGPSDGGDSGENVRILVENKLRIPPETDMPYRPTRLDHIPAWSPWIAERPFDVEREWSSSFYTRQFNADSVSLNPEILPETALTAPRYYGVSAFRAIAANDPAAIEAELAAGREVIADVGLRGRCDNDHMWTGDPLGQRETITRGSLSTDDLRGTVVDILDVRDPGAGGRVYLRGRDWIRDTDKIRWLSGGRRPVLGAAYEINYTRYDGAPAHSVLIVGYDRRNATNAFFIVKNSWGATSIAGARGFQYVSYNFIRNNAYSASCITEVTAPAAWPELQFLGRWNLEFDGWKGTLDIHHIPGLGKLSLLNRGDTSTDSRIGTFFDPEGHAFRVNGTLRGNDINFWIDSGKPNPRFTELGGRHFTYHLFRDTDDFEMAGLHQDPDGRRYAGYARKDKAFLSAVASPGPLQISSYLGRWTVNVDGNLGTMQLLWRSDAGAGPGWAGLYGTFSYPSGVAQPIQFKVSLSGPMTIEAIVPRPGSGSYVLRGKSESWNRGILAGEGSDPWGIRTGFYASRSGY